MAIQSPFNDGATLSVCHYNTKEAAQEAARALVTANKNPHGIFELNERVVLKDNPTIIEEVK